MDDAHLKPGDLLHSDVGFPRISRDFLGFPGVMKQKESQHPGKKKLMYGQCPKSKMPVHQQCSGFLTPIEDFWSVLKRAFDVGSLEVSNHAKLMQVIARSISLKTIINIFCSTGRKCDFIRVKTTWRCIESIKLIWPYVYVILVSFFCS